MQTGLVVETGEAREVHHFCVLAGYGAEAINPYLAFETLEEIRVREGARRSSRMQVRKNYIKAIGKGILKVMSKMGISTYQSYCGAQIFDAVGLVDARSSTSTSPAPRPRSRASASPRSPRRRCAATPTAYGDNPIYKTMLDVGGIYQLPPARRGARLDAGKRRQPAARGARQQLRELRGVRRVDQRAVRAAADDPRADGAEAGRQAARRSTRSSRPSEIVKRFATGAMSFGSISREAHTTLAIAMNRIGGRSNTGEGGEEADRFVPLPNGDSMRSAIKQVASRPVRRDHRIPGQRRRHPDQDGAGREARRRRPAARPQGRQDDRQGPPLDPRRRPDHARRRTTTSIRSRIWRS